MKNEQNEQTLEYFKKSAKKWKTKAESSENNEVNVVKQRNNYVMHVIEERESTDSMLDIGCGTGDLVCQLEKSGVAATGVDFASEMISIAENRKKEEALVNAKFVCSSIKDFDFKSVQTDVVSANGFIEYISTNEMIELFKSIYNSLKPNGSFVVGSRNRLFNIFCLNEFTKNELDESSVTELLRESLAITTENEISNLISMKCASIQKPDMEHKSTGIEVTKRFQYTPVQLCKILAQTGFVPLDIYPIHIHVLPPAFKKKHQDVHASISNMLQTYSKESKELIPFSSSFMLHAVKY